jgi:RNA polymerase sigma-70 factor (ECF subfamily)
MPIAEPDTDVLIGRIRRGDDAARQQLLSRHRDPLRRMIAVRMDRRLAPRLDPSDIVQDVLADADSELSDYLRRRPIPFYPWLRQLAWDRLVEEHRRHVRATKRTVKREEPDFLELPDESACLLADRLLDRRSSPSQHAVREETRRRVRAAIALLPDRDREVLVLRHLEQLTTAQTAGVLGITEAAVKARHVRALDRLQRRLEADGEDVT